MSIHYPTNNSSGGGSVSAGATTGTINLTLAQALADVITITPTGAVTFTMPGGGVCPISKRVSFYFTTSGTNSFTMTFGTNMRSTGTLATGVTSARAFVVTFICVDGTTWAERSRTAVQT